MSVNEFMKVDLHIHTAASVCYSDMQVTVHEIVAAAFAAELDIIAVADHNTGSSIEAVRIAAGDRLAVFPAVEVTAKNGHFLALFDVGTPVKEIDSFLDYAGIDENGRGDAHTTASDDTVVTLKKIHECGGIAIASHIDRWPSGFMESKASRTVKRHIHESEYLDALEITIPDTRQSWNEGKVRGYSMPRACIQGSDAHRPEEIGRRPVYLKMPSASLDGLKQALTDFQNSIRFPGE